MVQKEVWLENGSEAIRSERRNGSDWQRLGKTCKLKDVSFQCMTKFTKN